MLLLLCLSAHTACTICTLTGTVASVGDEVVATPNAVMLEIRAICSWRLAKSHAAASGLPPLPPHSTLSLIILAKAGSCATMSFIALVALWRCQQHWLRGR